MGTPRACYRSISIVSDGRLGVCDGAHWAFVMKKSQRPRPSLRDRTGHPFGSLFFVFLLLLFTCPSGDRHTGFQERLSIFIKAFEMRSKRTAKLLAVLHCQDVIDESAYVFDLTR